MSLAWTYVETDLDIYRVTQFEAARATPEGDENFNDVVLLLGLDGDLTDRGPAGGNTISTVGTTDFDTESPFGTQSLYIDGTLGGYLSVLNATNFDFGTGDFTIEGFFRRDGTQVANARLWCSSGSNFLTAFCASNTLLAFALGAVAAQATNLTFADATWAHVAATREGGILRIFVGGQLGVLHPADAASINVGGLFFGALGPSGGSEFKGWIGGIRVTKGLARYSSAFTAPDGPFPTQQAVAPVAVGGWTLAQGANTTFTGALNATLPSGRGARLQKTTSNADVVWRWSRVPNIANVSIVALLRSTSVEDMAVIARNTGIGTGYLLRFNNNDLEIRKGSGGAFNLLQSIDFEVVADENIWLRFDAVNVGANVLLRGKAWRGALNDEPSAFMIEATDSSSPITAAGPVGLYTNTNGADFLCGHFRAKSLIGSAVETLRYALPTDYLPRDIDAIPSLVSEPKLTPNTISLGEDLGQRASLSVEFGDHQHADLGELYDKGSYWSKFRARQLFRRGQPLRVKRGLLGQTFNEFETWHYVHESFDGPTPEGRYVWTAKDPLKLAQDDRAQAPRPNNGFLSSNLTNVATAATLLPSGIGNAEYAASGFIAIGGKEICTFTRSGDNLTLTRGQFGTTAIAHNGEDRVQQCLNYVGADPADILFDLLTEYAGIDPAQIPLSAWQTETGTFLQRVYTRLIAEPAGVNKLIAELIQQAGLALWHDDRLNKLRLQVLRGIPLDAYTYTEDTILARSLRTQEQPDKQITRVLSYYGVRNPLEPFDQPDNYRSSLETKDLDAEALNGAPVLKKIFGTWIAPLARSTAQRVNDLHIGRFVRPPRRLSFSVLRHSGVPEPEPGGGYRLTWARNQDEAGTMVPAPIQVVRAEATGDRVNAEAEEMLFKQFVADDLTDRAIVVDSNINNVNARTSYDSIYGTPTAQDIIDGVHLTITVNEGVIVGSNTTSARAFEIGAFPTTPATGNTTNGSPVITNLSVDPTNMFIGTHVTGPGIPAGAKIASINSPSQITLNMNASATAAGATLTFHFYVLLVVIGRLQGAGGNGGDRNGGIGSTPGSAGGTALYTRHLIDLDVDQGEVWGGGGGGGAGGFSASVGGGGPGGGGAGQLPGSGGSFSGGEPFGQPGTTEAGGAGADVSLGVDGGAGGNPGLAGAAGQNVGSFVGATAGGSAGAAIDGASFVTVTQGPGDVRGPQVN